MSQHVDVQQTNYLPIGHILTCPWARNCFFVFYFGLSKQPRAKSTGSILTKSSLLKSFYHVDVQRTHYLPIGHILTCPRARNWCFWHFGLCKQPRAITTGPILTKSSLLDLSYHVDGQRIHSLPIGHILTCPRARNWCFSVILDFVKNLEQNYLVNSHKINFIGFGSPFRCATDPLFAHQAYFDLPMGTKSACFLFLIQQTFFIQRRGGHSNNSLVISFDLVK